MISKTAIATENKNGFTYSLTSFGNAFVDFAAESNAPVVDVGCAYGIATLPALLTGAKVIAVDIEEKHLRSIERSVSPSLKENLTTINAPFPHFELKPSSVGAVYLSQVLPFLTADEINSGARKIYDWLIPGGHVVIVCFTPYINHVSAFIPEYEKRKKAGQAFPGYIDNLGMYCNNETMLANLPDRIMHLDREDLETTFAEAGFIIKDLRYFGEEEGELPEGIRFQGKERVGLIAFKPQTDRPHKPETWNHVADDVLARVPGHLQEWLTKPAVLTTALKRVCNDLTLVVKDEQVKHMLTQELLALDNHESTLGYVRETCLGGEGNPLVYARVTMPYNTYLSKREALEKLGTRPIGETLLYNDGDITRSPFEIKKITQDDELLFDALVHQNFFQAVIEKKAIVPELWARRSTFTFGAHKLLVTEVFLANIPAYTE
jgi:chorismate-pyruvate lyase/predicted SAM-dependent methyltransferase